MNTISLKEFLECTGFKITSTSEYVWSSYGRNAISIDYWNKKHGDEEVTISAVLNTDKQVIYEMQAWDFSRNLFYRWISPEIKESYKKECIEKNYDFKVAIDDKDFTDLDLVEDIIEKATAIANNVEYDTRVKMQLELDDDTLFQAMLSAHEKDITLNKYIELALSQEIDRLKQPKVVK